MMNRNTTSEVDHALQRRALLREAMSMASDVSWKTWQEVRRQMLLMPLPKDSHRLVHLARMLERNK